MRIFSVKLFVFLEKFFCKYEEEKLFLRSPIFVPFIFDASKFETEKVQFAYSWFVKCYFLTQRVWAREGSAMQVQYKYAEESEHNDDGVLKVERDCEESECITVGHFKILFACKHKAIS